MLSPIRKQHSQTEFQLNDLADSFLSSPERMKSVDTCLLEVMCKTQNQKKLIEVVDLAADKNAARRCLRQVSLLKTLKHMNLLELKSGLMKGRKVFLEFGHLDFDLARVLQSKPVAWTSDHVKFILYQIVLGIAYLHSRQVAHLDLNPKNILLSKECDVKLTGFSKSLPKWLPPAPGLKLVYQDFYKAPETILNNEDSQNCFFKADIWALGCTFFELMEQKHILNHKRQYQDQLKTMFSLLGRPSRNQLDFVVHPSTRNWVLSTAPHPTRKPSSYLSPRNSDPLARDLLDKMLTINPHDRPSACEILKHPFFSCVFEPSDLKFGRGKIQQKIFRECVPDLVPNSKVVGLLGKRLSRASF